MWSYTVSFGLVLIQKTTGLVLSSMIAPVPTPEDTGSGSLVWTLAGVVAGLIIGLIVYKIVNKPKGKK